jgi:hypothetical protein
LIFVAACSGGPRPAPTPQPPASKCPAVADHLVSLLAASQNAPQEDTDRFRRVFAERCEKDAWSAKAQHCFLAAANAQALSDNCSAELTQQQQEAFGAAVLGESKPKSEPKSE